MSLRMWCRLLLTFGFLCLLGLAGPMDHLAQGSQEPGKDEPSDKGRRNLSPEERRQLRERYKQFKQLPPEEQEKLRQRLKEFQSLPEDQQERLRQRGKLFRDMTPEQQERFRKFQRRWRNLPPRATATLGPAAAPPSKFAARSKGTGAQGDAILEKARSR